MWTLTTKGNEMSKFKAGDWWRIRDFNGSYKDAITTAIKHLVNDGWMVESYIGDNLLHIHLSHWDFIGIVQWSELDGGKPVIAVGYNGSYMLHESNLKQWSAFEQTHYECPYAIIEELEAHNESLEDTVVALTKEVLELRKNVASQTATFKPISEMTIEDWVLAKEDAWVFEDGTGEFFIVVDIDLADIYPIKCNDENHYTLDGVWNDNVKGSVYDLKQRIK